MLQDICKSWNSVSRWPVSVLLLLELVIHVTAQIWDPRGPSYLEFYEGEGSGNDEPVVYYPHFSAQRDPPRRNQLGPEQPRALTQSQYRMAESILGKTWDRSHLLENLAGMEADCGMLRNRRWDFSKAEEEATSRGYSIRGFFAHRDSIRNTQDSLNKILRDIKRQISRERNMREVGCVVITNCYGGKMVVTCILGTPRRFRG